MRNAAQSATAQSNQDLADLADAVAAKLKERAATNFELFRLTASKREVDLSPNTLRKYFKEGLPYYRKGKAVFVSRTELREFITA